MSLAERQQRTFAREQCRKIVSVPVKATAPWEELLGPQLVSQVRRIAEHGEVSPQTIIREAVRAYTGDAR